jgi:hypothetical protein
MQAHPQQEESSANESFVQKRETWPYHATAYASRWGKNLITSGSDMSGSSDEHLQPRYGFGPRSHKTEVQSYCAGILG